MTQCYSDEVERKPLTIGIYSIPSVRQAVLQNLNFTISELSGQFLQMSRSLLHDIVSLWQENVSATTVRYRGQ